MPRPRPWARVALIFSVLLAACSTAGGSRSASPSASAADPTMRPPSSATPAPSSSPSATAAPVTTYTVLDGDTLAAIARRFGTSVGQLQAWNADRYPSLADDPSTIQAGWTLVVAAAAGVTPIPAPSATPAPTPPPVASGCSAGDRVPAGSPETHAAIPGAGAGVALTFDMGGRMDPAADIMRFLVANQVCATIFATGVMAQTPQGAEVMAIIRDHPELFEIANHTMHHCDLARGGGGSPSVGPCQTGGPPTAAFVRAQLSDAEAILRTGTGQDPRPYWRPPYGSLNAAVVDAAAAAGYTKTFMWDIDTIDWKPIADGGPSAEQIAARVVGGAVNGSNVLFHLGGYETLDALALLVPALRDRGFTLTSLSDLLH